MQRKITGFDKDEIGDWFAYLECGHKQHTRHNPPWENRPWILTEEGRNSFIGMELNCLYCDENTTSLLCKCGKDSKHKLVAPNAHYRLGGYILMAIGISSCPIKVERICLTCGHVFETITDPFECNKYRYV